LRLRAELNALSAHQKPHNNRGKDTMGNVRKISVAAFFISLIGFSAQSAAAFDRFITMHDGMLMDGSKQFRFISFNVPNLNYIEDDMRFAQTNPYRLPTEYEMRDALTTIKDLGGQVVRIYTVPVKSKAFPAEAPTYVLAPGQFNEEAFRRMDLMLALANEYGIRLIIPLVNNWPWMGGRPEYAAFRGKTENDFWTDPQIIADVQATIRHVLERRNTVTGILYKDDKAILCWETGNELDAPFSWTVQMTRFIKSLDPHHLVMDGSRDDARAKRPAFVPEALTEPSIDIVTTHHYEPDPMAIPGHVRDNVGDIKRKKAYIVGEFGFAPTASNARILDEVIAAKHDISGALLWSLRFHNSDGGYYWHSEPFGDNLYKAFYWPGSALGQSYDNARMMRMVRDKAFAIQGLPVPPIRAPKPPHLQSISDPSSITWLGSVGASTYNVERATNASGPWKIIGYDISDADVPYFPLFQDCSAKPGDTFYYRVRARNEAGLSKPSNVSGPVHVTESVIVDTMKNLGLTQSSKGITPVTGSDRSFKEISNRLAGKAGSELIYGVPGHLNSFEIFAFENSPSPALQVLASPDGENWQDLSIHPIGYAGHETNYEYWTPRLYRAAPAGSIRFIKIVFKTGAAQLARARLAYIPQ
jgi:hypothetical protein